MKITPIIQKQRSENNGQSGASAPTIMYIAMMILTLCVSPLYAQHNDLPQTDETHEASVHTRRSQRKEERQRAQEERERRRQREWRVRAVSFYGNASYSDKELLTLMELKPKWPNYDIRFTNFLMNSDLEILRAFYKSMGFERVNVSLDRVERDSTSRRVRIHIAIEEGPRVHVGEVIVAADNFTPRPADLRRLATRTGRPLVFSNVRQDSRLIRSMLGYRGYLAADVVPAVDIDTQSNLARVIFNVTEGPKAAVGSIEFLGGERLRPSVIRQELTFRGGDTLNLRAVQQSERRLYATGLFNYVQITPQFDTARAVTELPDSTYDVHVHVSTSDFFRVQGRVGYNTDEGFMGSATASYLNMFRLGQGLTLDGKLSQISQSAEALYTIPLSSFLPSLFDASFLSFFRPLNFETKVYYNRYDNTDLYEGVFRGVRFSVDRQFDRFTADTRHSGSRVFYQAWTQWEQLEWIKVPAAEGLNLKNVPDRPTQSIGGNLGLDARNDLFNPTKGGYANIDGEIAGVFGGGYDKYVKIGLDTRAYFSRRSRYFLSTALRTGYVTPYGHSEVVPIQSKFYGGGGNTVRGFAVNKLAVQPNGDPMVGDFYTFLNIADFRFPIYWLINGAFFLDAGNVWHDITDITSASGFFDDLRWSAGPGLRVDTPIKLVVRLDMGFKLNRRPNESAWELHFDLGQPF